MALGNPVTVKDLRDGEAAPSERHPKGDLGRRNKVRDIQEGHEDLEKSKSTRKWLPIESYARQAVQAAGYHC